ncbi:MAG: PDZ domain-containing protein [Planctomycetaceae bacterium]|nr:PDZ domain-containing protein [Planctomycetaceae bacterium]
MRRRSATENVVFGQIVSTDDHRLTLREGEGDSATETVYRLSPEVRVYVRNRQVELNELTPETRIRFPRVTGPDGEIAEIYAVEDDDIGPPATVTDSAEPSPAPTRVIKDEDSPSVENDVVPEVDLGAALETTTEGVEVVRIDPISPLREAGMNEGDFIKTAAGKSVVTPKALFRILNEFDGGATVALTAHRNGEEQEFSLTLPAEHKKVLVDPIEETASAGGRNNLSVTSGDRGSHSRLLQQIRRTQEQQQAQLKYLYDGMLQLAQAAGVNQRIFGNSAYPFGGVLPIGGFGVDGTGGTGGNCYGAIGFDAAGNPVIGVTEAGVALGVFGFNENGYPILRETTLVTPVNSGGNGTTDLNGDGIPDGDTNGDGIPDDYNNDGLPDDGDGDGFPPNPAIGDGQAPQQPPETNPAELNNPIPPQGGEPPFRALPGSGAGQRRPVAPQPRRTAP